MIHKKNCICVECEDARTIPATGAREALDPCPFCGILPDLRLSQMDRETWMVACEESECGYAEVCAVTEEEAVAQWNSRRPALAGPQTGAPDLEAAYLHAFDAGAQFHATFHGWDKSAAQNSLSNFLKGKT